MKIKIIIVVFVIVHCTFIIENCVGQWVQCDGIYGGCVYSIALSENNIFAGTYGKGVYLSTNNDTTWINTGLITIQVLSLTISGNNIFAGTNAGVFLSTNNGTIWMQTALNNRTVNSLTISGSNIFAGSNLYGVYISTNDGNNWTQTALNDKYVESLAISGNYIFAGTMNYGVYLSTNNGNTWTQTALNDKYVESLAISGNYIFAGTSDNGVYFSSNNGLNWVQKNQGFNYVPTFPSIRALLIYNGYIFAGTIDYSVYRRLISDITGTKNISMELPVKSELGQNCPNPFNQSSIINYKCSIGGMIHIKIYDISGKEVAELVNEYKPAGIYSINFHAKDLPSGLYFYRMETDKFTETKKLILLK